MSRDRDLKEIRRTYPPAREQRAEDEAEEKSEEKSAEIVSQAVAAVLSEISPLIRQIVREELAAMSQSTERPVSIGDRGFYLVGSEYVKAVLPAIVLSLEPQQKVTVLYFNERRNGYLDIRHNVSIGDKPGQFTQRLVSQGRAPQEPSVVAVNPDGQPEEATTARTVGAAASGS